MATKNSILALILTVVISLQLIVRLGLTKKSQLEIKMAYVRPDHAEQYLCVSHRLPMGNMAEYIVGFNPVGSAKRIHHMLLYGCEWPGYFNRDSPQTTWDCSEMMQSGSETKLSFHKAPICQGKTQILYGWAMDAPALKLPDKVGFKIGGVNTGIHFLVLQVHYAHVHGFELNPLMKDHSGLLLDMRRDDDDSGITRRAGVLLMASNGRVKQGVSKHEITCQVDEDAVIHPFRFRVHTHKLGVEVQGYKISPQRSWIERPDKNLIGFGDPQKPQMFYKVENEQMTIQRGDKVYASCMFNNTKFYDVKIGQTGNDEMCNFYIMYWTDGNQLLKQDTCISTNPLSFLDRLE